MSEFKVTIESGETKRFKTAFKYCDRDIVVTASGGGDDLISSFIEGNATSIESESVRNIAHHRFYQDDTIQEVYFPNATSLGEYAFYDCPNLETIYAPNLDKAETRSIYQTKISKIYFPKLSEIGVLCFEYNQELTTADVGSIKSLGTSAFGGCSSLRNLILRYSEDVVTLSDYNGVFQGTPFLGGGSSFRPTVYVPRNLIANYKQSGDWATLYNNGWIDFYALEDSSFANENWGKE